MHPAHGINKVRSVGDAEEALRSDLAASTVKMERLEQQARDAQAGSAVKDGRINELTQQLDAHRQEHARQAATIVTLRQRLQDEEESRITLQGNARRAELTLGALGRESREYAERVLELEARLRTHLEERESAEQRSADKIQNKINMLVEDLGSARSQLSNLEDSLHQTGSEASSAQQSVKRLVNELDDEKRKSAEQQIYIDDYKKEGEELRTRVRALEEEVKSVRERLHNTNKSYNSTLEELHAAEKQLQQEKDVEWRGFATTLATLLSTPENRISSDAQPIIEKVQGLVTSSKESAEMVERLTNQVTSLNEQSRRTTELYESSVKRARQAETDTHALLGRFRQLEAELVQSEASSENLSHEKEKAQRVVGRVVEALGLAEMGQEVTQDLELIVCRAQQLAKLEGEKIVDKTTTVYQLQRKVKSLRESVDRKDLHVDMLRRKMGLMEDASRASRHLEEERDDLFAKYKRQVRLVERLNNELAEVRLQLRDHRGQLADAADEKTRGEQMKGKVEELSAKIQELDTIRSRQQKKINQLKEQVKTQSDHMLEERRLNENSMEQLTADMATTKQALRDLARKEKQASEFRRTVLDLTGTEGDLIGNEADYDALCRLERLVGAHRELGELTRRMEEVTGPSRPNRNITIFKNIIFGFSKFNFGARTLASRSPPLRPPSRPSSAAPPYRFDSPTRSPPSNARSPPSNASPRRELLSDDAHNHRPPRPARRPSSACSRTPSPHKRPSTDEEEYF
ncbi:unnamed protein product, partial [Meganyctiphanes norvegica]